MYFPAAELYAHEAKDHKFGSDRRADLYGRNLETDAILDTQARSRMMYALQCRPTTTTTLSGTRVVDSV